MTDAPVSNLRCPRCGSVVEDVARDNRDGKIHLTCGCIVSVDVRKVLLFAEEKED